jgi:hypothetical protein
MRDRLFERSGAKRQSEISLSRRSLLRAGALAGVLGGPPSVSSAGHEETSTRSTGSTGDPVWMAQDRVLNRTGDTVDQSQAVFSANTTLQYLGAQWEELGNPSSSADVEGAWQHTFVLSSYGMGLKPPYLFDTNTGDGIVPESDYIPARQNYPLPGELSEDAREVLRKRAQIGDRDVSPNRASVGSRPAFEIKTLPKDLRTFTGEPVNSAEVDDLAIATRRDSQLFGFANPDDFLVGQFGEAFPRSDTPGDVFDREQLIRGLRVFDAHATDLTNVEYDAVTEPSLNGRLEEIEQARARRDATVSLGQSIYGTATSFVGLSTTIAGVSNPWVTVPMTALGIITDSLGLAQGISGVFNNDVDAEAPGYIGVHQQSPFDKLTSPLTYTYVVFDVYQSPETETEQPQVGESDGTSLFTVRTNYDLSVRTQRGGVSVNPGRSNNIWVVRLERSPPPGELDGDTPTRARLLNAEAARQRIADIKALDSNEGTNIRDNYEIQYDDGTDNVVQFRPTASFTVELPPEDDRPVAGKELVFDPSDTILGGAPIEEYEWVFGYLHGGPGGVLERDDVDRIQRSGRIFDAPDSGVLRKEFTTAGVYSVSLRVWDENDEEHVAFKTLRVRQRPNDDGGASQLIGSRADPRAGDPDGEEAGGDTGTPTGGQPTQTPQNGQPTRPLGESPEREGSSTPDGSKAAGGESGDRQFVTATVEPSVSTVLVGDQFEVSADPSVTDGAAGSVVPAGAGTGEERRFIYEWDALLRSTDDIRAVDSVRDPDFLPGGAGSDPEFETVPQTSEGTRRIGFEIPGEYEVFVRVSDAVTGDSAVASTTVTVMDELPTVSVDPTGTFLHTSSDAATAPTVVSLSDYGIEPGDEIILEVVGTWTSGRGIEKTDTIGVFSSTDELLPSDRRRRVPGAIDAGPDFETKTTYYGDEPTDIEEDFRVDSETDGEDDATPSVTVTVPEDARYLFLAAHGSLYRDNYGEYSVRIRP